MTPLRRKLLSAALLVSCCGTTADSSTQKAELTTTVVLIGLAVASYAAAYLLRPKPNDDLRVQSEQSTLTTRGSQLQLLIGFRRVQPVVAWIGDRRIEQQSAGGGKSLFGGSGPKQTVYYEGGVHLLATGPCSRLHRIIQRGEVLWEGPIDSNSTPSGTSVATSQGTFVIYWGETDQPINTRLGEATRIGIASRWPFICYIEWIDKFNGTSQLWDVLEYDLEAEGVGSTLSGSRAILKQGADPAIKDDGPNAAHALYQLITAPWPHGCGAPVDILDFERLEDFGILMEAEHTPVHILIQGDQVVADAITDLMFDLGFFLVQDGEVLVVKPIRYEASIPTFTGMHLVQPNPEIETRQGESDVDRVLYLFTDRNNAFRPTPVPIDDDAESRYFSRRKQQDQSLRTITDSGSAATVADRKQLESLTSITIFRFQVAYSGQSLMPGHAAAFTGYGNCRVTSVKYDTDKAFASIECILDQYSYAATGYDPGNQITNGGTGSPENDTFVGLFEIPYSYAKESLQIGILRIRGSVVSGEAVSWISADGTAYYQGLPIPSVVSGGYLISDLTEDSIDPIIAAFNTDISRVLDLTSDETSWLSGRQLCLIDKELCFVRSVTAVTGGYQIDGMIRGVGGTIPTEHPAGSLVYIFTKDDVVPVTDPVMAPGVDLRVKTVVAGKTLASTPANDIVLEGAALSPYPVDNVGILRHEFGGELLTITAVDAATQKITVDGYQLHHLSGGMWIETVSNTGADNGVPLQIHAVELSGADTVLTIRDIGFSDLNVDGSIRVMKPRGERYHAGETAWIGWTYRNRNSGGVGAGEQLSTTAFSGLNVREGVFTIEIIDPSTDLVVFSYTLNADAPRIGYTYADRLVDFGTGDPDSFIVRISNTLGGGAYVRQRTILKD